MNPDMTEQQQCRVCGITILGRRSMAKVCSQVCQSRLEYLNRRDDLLGQRAERYAKDPNYRQKIRIHRIAAKILPVLGPCEECGKPGKHRHHDSDAHPEIIRVLCVGCHRRWHVANPGTELTELRTA